MPKDPDGVEYAALRGEDPELALFRRRQRRRISRLLVMATAVFGLIMLLVLVVPPASRESLPPPFPEDGLLADVRGEDALYRLEVTQAALKREMALLRGWISGEYEGEFASPADVDLARSLAELEAGHAILGARIARLEASQRALHDLVGRMESTVLIPSERLNELDKSEERN